MTHETKHTPAPWIRSIWGEIVVWPKYHRGCYIQKGNDELIAFVTANDDEVGKSNAAMIETAPEMYEALSNLAFAYQSLLNHYEPQNVENSCALPNARKVLAKARGEA